jgi:hypothetical protein
MTCVVVRIAPECEVGALEGLLWDAFTHSLAALEQGAPVVLVVDDGALAGDASPAASALAAGALGLARALATEGARTSWWINVLSLPATASPADIEEWVERLGEPHGASGTVVRLGTRHQRRTPL